MEERKISLYQQQKIAKPLIEELIPEFLNGELRQIALDFVAHMRANKMKPVWTLTNTWKAVYKGRCICYISLAGGGDPAQPKDKWLVTPYLEHIQEYEDQIVIEGLQNYIWDNVIYCVNGPKESPSGLKKRHFGLNPPCNLWNCAPGRNITLCGKEIHNLCRNSNRRHFWFLNPNEAEAECLKRLLELEQKARIEDKARLK